MKKIIILFIATLLSAAMPEHYYKIKSSKLQKKEFFSILTPLIKQANDSITKDRNEIKNIFKILQNTSKSDLSQELSTKLKTIAKKYKIKNIYDKKSLLTRINTIPTSLVLAQAAVESGWGKSRFIKLANNIFGHWTYSKSGLLPQKRTKGMKHRIRVFKTLQDSIAAYMLNLNTHMAYFSFRATRLESINNNKTFTGNKASEKMEKYSAIGKKYVKMLKAIIRQNNLENY